MALSPMQLIRGLPYQIDKVQQNAYNAINAIINSSSGGTPQCVIKTVSSVPTSGNGNWTAIGLSITTTGNTKWLLSGSLLFSDSGTAPGYSFLDYTWATGDGSNSPTPPIPITPLFGLPGPIGGSSGSTAQESSIRLLKTTEIIVAANTTVFLVPLNSELVANDVLISGQITAIQVTT